MIAATITRYRDYYYRHQSIVIGVLLAVLVWQVWRLVKMLQTEVQPIIKDAQETVSTVRGTTTFVSDSVVNPVVKTTSTLVGIRRTVSSLTADLRPQRRSRKRAAAPTSQQGTPADPFKA
ncbi:MAG: hypothetical protein R2867_13315 [Caldilineaceae bacterium]